MQRSSKRKVARLEARISPAIYSLVQRAAELQGRSVSDFVVSAAQRAAETTIAKRELIELSRADQEQFAAALLKPAPLAPALRRAMEAHRKLVERP